MFSGDKLSTVPMVIENFGNSRKKVILESPGKVLKTAKEIGGPGIMTISRKVLESHGFPFYMDIVFD